MPPELMRRVYLGEMVGLLGIGHENIGMRAQTGIKRGRSGFGCPDDEEVWPCLSFHVRLISLSIRLSSFAGCPVRDRAVAAPSAYSPFLAIMISSGHDCQKRGIR